MNTETISNSAYVVPLLSFLHKGGFKVYRQLWFKSHFFGQKIIWFKSRL